MKMLFHSGSIDENNTSLGIGKIHFITNGMDILDGFHHSLWFINGLLGIYDVEHYKKINDKDVYYFYHTKTKNQEERVADKQEIVTELDAIMAGSIANIVNYEDAMIKEAAEDIDINKELGFDHDPYFIEETIFWDVINHFIIVIGKDQLEKLAYTFMEERFKDAFAIYSGLTKDEFLSNFVTSEEMMPESIKKMLSFVKQEKEETKKQKTKQY